MSIIMLVYVYRGNVSRGLLLGITLVLGLSSLPHLLSEVIGFSTVFGKSSNLSALEVKEAAPLAQSLYQWMARLTLVEVHRQGPRMQSVYKPS